MSPKERKSIMDVRERIAARRAEQDAKRAEAERVANTPSIGEGATEILFSDKAAYVVTAISKTGAVVTLAPLRPVDLATGHQPRTEHNGFPVWDHQYTAEELVSLRYDNDRTIRATRRKDGRYYSGGSRIVFGGARYYRNYAD